MYFNFNKKNAIIFLFQFFFKKAVDLTPFYGTVKWGNIVTVA